MVKLKWSGKCLDTNVIIKLEKEKLIFEKFLEEENNYFFPLVCQAELMTGYKGKDEKIRIKIWNEIKDGLNLKIINSNEKSINYYSELFWKLKNKGKKITQNDLWILTLCFQNNLELITFDQKLEKHWRELVNNKRKE